MEHIYAVDEIRKIAKRHGVERMFLFGPYACGDAKPDSDLDFRIDKGHIHGLFALGALHADLEDAFILPVDLLTTDSLDESFRREIASEEVQIYEISQKRQKILKG